MTTLTPARNPRLPLIDLLRGVAIVAMIGYHLMWDLSYLRFLGFDISEDLRFVVAQRCILGSFLFLVGVGLELGHGSGIRWRGFWRRWLLLVGAALLMSLGTFLMLHDAFSFFGILHAIALFSLLGLLFVRAPVWLSLVVAAVVIAMGVTLHADAFNVRWLAWLGFWTEPPTTADLVAVFPWFGVVLIGIAAGKLLPWRDWTWAPRDIITRTLRLMGRWSLVIYLVHQPLLLAVLEPLAMWLQPGQSVVVAASPETFPGQCQAACVARDWPEGYCTAYCGCALEQIVDGALWDAINAPNRTPLQSQQVGAVMALCQGMAETAK